MALPTGVQPSGGVHIDADGVQYLRVDLLTAVPLVLDAATLAALETIGLDAATLAALETISVASQPARQATVDSITAKLGTDKLHDGTTALTPQFAVIDHATSGDNTVKTAHATKKIRVVSLFLVSAGTVTVRFEGGAGGTALTGQMNLVANAGFVLPFNPVGWFETATNTLLNLELSGAVSVDGCFTFVEV